MFDQSVVLLIIVYPCLNWPSQIFLLFPFSFCKDSHPFSGEEESCSRNFPSSLMSTQDQL
jgi:hypothetical protein